MLKYCAICNTSFETITNSCVCSEGCRETRKKNTDKAKAKRYRENHNHDDNYRKRKKQYDNKHMTIYNCSECGRSVELSQRLFDKKKSTLCANCVTSGEAKELLMAKRQKPKNNTSGYIGIYILNKSWDKDTAWGYNCKLMSGKRTILNNRYKDYELHNSTLMHALIDRELFIIENSLPHTRNLTEMELLGMMEKVAHNQLNEIISKVSNGTIILSEVQNDR